MKVITDIQQGTQEWHKLRCGRVTGTCLADIMGTPTARMGLICELIAEEATEQTKVDKVSSEMERGNAEEVFAIRAYEEKYGEKVDKVTICISDQYDWLAVSPDGLIKTGKKYTKAVEVKNPDSKKMISYRIANATKSKSVWCGIPIEYKWQVVMYFIVNQDLQSLDFIVYDARFINDESKLFVVTVERKNPEAQIAINDAVKELETFRSEWMKYRALVLPDNF